MDSEEVRYLKCRYREAPSAEKKVKFSDIEDDLVQHFPSTSYNAQRVSQAIAQAFPQAISKRHGKKRHKFLFGIDVRPTEECEQPSVDALVAENMELKVRVKELEARIAELEKKVKSMEELDVQMHRALHTSNAIFHGPNSINNFENFSLDTVLQEVRQHAPDVLSLFSALARLDRHDEDHDTAHLSQLRVVMALCTLLKGRSTKVLGIQLLISFMLVARATSKQAITVLNHAGVCVSYSGAWKYLKQLTTEARFLDIVRDGHWQWVYDNLNFLQHVRHEREGIHSSMMNVTTRLAVRIRFLPEFPFDWSDTSPQKSRQSLTVEDYLPNASESQQLEERATHYMMGFLVEAFTCLEDLRPFVPAMESLHQPQKSQVIPMKLLFRDEKYKSETIQILSQLIKDANLSGDPEIVIGDQLTCKNIRGYKLWRQPEIDPTERLTWANEIPGNFHFLWECLRVVFSIFWGNPSLQGSLCNMREVINRKQVDKKVKVFSVGDEFLLHAFKAHLTARVCTLFNINSPADNIQHPCSMQWLHTTAQWLMNESLKPIKLDDPVYSLHRSFLHIAFLYVDLRNAIRFENGPQIITHWKLWLPRFIATGCKNYAVESIHLLTNLYADLPKHLAYIAIHNRTVNIEGKPGKGKPLDQMMEHYNLVVKQAMRSGGGNLTDAHAEDVSLCALFLMEAAKATDKEFEAHRTTAHTIRDANKDILKISTQLLMNSVTCAVQNRTSPAFEDPTDDGLAKICNTAWVKDILAKVDSPQIDDENLGEQEGENFIDLDYEISDVL